jgi:hypothetical protein
MHPRYHLWCKDKIEVEKTRQAWWEWLVWSTAHASMFNMSSGRFTLLIPLLGHPKVPLVRCSTNERKRLL